MIMRGICLILCPAGLTVFWKQGLAAPIVSAFIFIGAPLLAKGRGIWVWADWSSLHRQMAKAGQ
jgi:hypothetical protein